MSCEILCGDNRAILPTLPESSVQCCVTSPPYWGLRDYGVDGQIGLERTPEEYVAQMVAVFREVRRVLKDDGTLWVNLGDTYGRNPAKGSSGTPTGRNGRGERYPTKSKTASEGAWMAFGTEAKTRTQTIKEKDLVGIPWRVAFALQSDGWWLRSDIIWQKPNPMPESVTDRPTKSHEYIFLLAKSERYWYDADAVSEPSLRAGDINGGCYGGNPPSFNVGRGIKPTTIIKERRNIRSVWTVATQPYREAHFATFPEKLIEPCILAGCPVGGTVLDPFGGSGTVGQVCERLGRNSILIELNPDYIELQRARTAQMGIFTSKGNPRP